MRRLTSALGASLPLALIFASAVPAQQSTPLSQARASAPAIATVPAPGTPDPMLVGKQALAHGDFKAAQEFFADFLKDNPGSNEASFYAGEAAFNLKQYDQATRYFNSVIANTPAMWPAHKNLVMVLAAQNNWPEFDRERQLIQQAREAGAPGLDPNDADVIDLLYVGPERYIVRAYGQLAGRFKTRYNFTHYSKEGKLDFWISCESDDIDQVTFAQTHPKEAAEGKRSFSLDSYTQPTASAQGTGQTHGTLKFYPDGEPAYEIVRADVMSMLEHKSAPVSTTTTHSTPHTSSEPATPPKPAPR